MLNSSMEAFSQELLLTRRHGDCPVKSQIPVLPTRPERSGTSESCHSDIGLDENLLNSRIGDVRRTTHLRWISQLKVS